MGTGWFLEAQDWSKSCGSYLDGGTPVGHRRGRSPLRRSESCSDFFVPSMFVIDYPVELSSEDGMLSAKDDTSV